MTMAPRFDTLRHAQELEAAGVPEKQARATVQVIASAMDEALPGILERFATREDFAGLKAKVETLQWAAAGGIAMLAAIAGKLFLGH